MKTIGYITTFLILAFLSALWSGYALSVLWGWFMVPAFSLPPLSIGYAIGVAMVVSYLTQTIKLNNGDTDWKKALVDGVAVAAVRPAISLLLGWVVTLFL
jgi:hypothetical protein